MDISVSKKSKQNSVAVFCCYAHEDEELLDELKRHLSPLQHQQIITVWHDRNISAGAIWEKEIKRHIDEAQIILLLISSDFMNSKYCYGIEMKRAMERHERGETHVIPVILRPVYWQETPFGKLQALPTAALPVTGRSWHDRDEAFANIAWGIRLVVEKLRSGQENMHYQELFTGTSQQREASRSSHVKLIDASLDPDDSPYEQTIEQGRKTIRYTGFPHKENNS